MAVNNGHQYFWFLDTCKTIVTISIYQWGFDGWCCQWIVFKWQIFRMTHCRAGMWSSVPDLQPELTGAMSDSCHGWTLVTIKAAALLQVLRLAMSCWQINISVCWELDMRCCLLFQHNVACLDWNEWSKDQNQVFPEPQNIILNYQEILLLLTSISGRPLR